MRILSILKTQSLPRIFWQLPIVASGIPVLLLVFALVAGNRSDHFTAKVIRHFAPLLSIPSVVSGTGDHHRRILDPGNKDPVFLQGPLVAGPNSYILLDAGLTHIPVSSDPTGQIQYARTVPEFLILNGGSCEHCEKGDPFYRPRNVRIQILTRRANNWDQEYFIPEPRIVYTRTMELQNSSKPAKIPFPDVFAPDAGETIRPKAISLILIKIQILDTHAPDASMEDEFESLPGLFYGFSMKEIRRKELVAIRSVRYSAKKIVPFYTKEGKE